MNRRKVVAVINRVNQLEIALLPLTRSLLTVSLSPSSNSVALFHSLSYHFQLVSISLWTLRGEARGM